MQTLNEKLPQIPKENAFYFMRLICCLIVIYEIRKNYEMEK